MMKPSSAKGQAAEPAAMLSTAITSSRHMAVAVLIAALSVPVLSGLVACSSTGGKDAAASAASAASAPPPPAPAPSVPAVKVPTAAQNTLAEGVKSYQSGKYHMAETQLKLALKDGGLTEPADIASANKYLAFIYCSSKRYTSCTAAFKAAKAADPNFALTKAEAGHPMWTKTYKKAMGLK